MISFKEHITYDLLVSTILELGYDQIKKKSGYRFAVLVNGNRVSAMKNILAGIQQKIPDAKWDEEAGSSSLGAIVIGRFMISVSPASKQGKASAGLQNEHTLFNMIGEITKDGPMTIVFRSGSDEYKVEDVVGYRDAGRDTKGRKKADIILIDKEDAEYPISLKKDGAEMWESADKYWSVKAKETLDKLVTEGEVELVPFKGVYRLKPNVAVKATRSEALDVVFGSDILGKGCVLIKTYKGGYKIEDNKAIIDVTKIITKLSDLKGEYEVYFLIRNDSSRKGSKIYPGIRVLAVNKSRVNRRVKVVK